MSELDCTMTEYADYDVFQYVVCWRKKNWISEWNIKFFANKKDAQIFARKKKKEDKTKPYPYIVQIIAHRNTFRNEIQCEECNIDFKTMYDRDNYKKFIKY